MSDVSLPKLGKASEIHDAGEAWAETSTGQVLVACVNGHVCDLRPNKVDGWEVDEHGKVTPSIFCRTPMPDGSLCDWHVFATLEGWVAGE
jgi:hypothetical protein